jgi:aryl-alcohol dehydrogenase-like predicted oxidoreductase
MADLPRRMLGNTDMEVTTLAYGAMEMRGGGRGPEVSDEEAERVLNAVLDSGINFIDTSIDYGKSEERIGQFISHRRGEYFLASKCGCVPGAEGGADHVHTAANIRAGVERSLALMKTDYLDLVQFHRSLTPEEFDEEGALSEVLRLRDGGKVRYIGVSGTLPNLSDQVDMGLFDAFQIPYSALQRDHEDVIAKASEAGAGIIIRGGAARGAPTDWESRTYYMVPGTQMRDIWELAGLDGLLDGMSRMEFTLRFTLSNPDLDATIVGTRNLEHLDENIGFAMRGPLPAATYEEAKQRLAAAGSAPAS